MKPDTDCIPQGNYCFTMIAAQKVLLCPYLDKKYCKYLNEEIYDMEKECKINE